MFFWGGFEINTDQIKYFFGMQIFLRIILFFNLLQGIAVPDNFEFDDVNIAADLIVRLILPKLVTSSQMISRAWLAT